MNRRNLTTTMIVVTAGLLLYGGVALAQERQSGDVRPAQVVATQSPSATDLKDDNGRASGTPELEPSASPDDHGGNAGDDDNASPTASPDDHGGSGGGSDDSALPTTRPTTGPTASPDDHGGSGGGSDDSASPTASPTATASPDDHGGSGGGGSDD